MFTGIITALGSIVGYQSKPDGGARLELIRHGIVRILQMGASIACSGICLTLVDATANQLYG